MGPSACNGLTQIRPWTRVMPMPLMLRQVPSEYPRLGFLFHLNWFCTGFPSSTAFSGGSWGKFDLSNPASPASSEWEHKLLLSPSVMSDSLQPHGQQHARLCILHYLPECAQTQVHWVRWYHPTISSCVAPFSFWPQSFPASGSFPVSQLFTSGGQSIRASTSVLPMNIQGWFPLGLTGLISLQSKGLSRVFFSCCC